MENKYCSKCKATGVSLITYSYNRNKTKAYYNCRKCNNERGRKYYSENKERCRAIIYKSIEKHKEKQAARILLNCAVRSKKIIKPKKCSSCNLGGRIQGHHADYSKPFEVEWLCVDCHAIADKACDIL